MRGTYTDIAMECYIPSNHQQRDSLPSPFPFCFLPLLCQNTQAGVMGYIHLSGYISADSVHQITACHMANLLIFILTHYVYTADRKNYNASAIINTGKYFKYLLLTYYLQFLLQRQTTDPATQLLLCAHAFTRRSDTEPSQFFWKSSLPALHF